MRRPFFAICVCVFAAGTTWGQTPSAADQAQTVKALLERIEKLEKRVEELEGRPAARPVAVMTEAKFVLPASTEPGAAVPSAEKKQEPVDHAEHVAARQMDERFPSLQWRGFADVDFSATNQKGTFSGFNLGQFDLQITSALAKKISYFAEITFTAQPAGYALEVERTLIRYDYNDYFKLSFGRYHTPINYWNTAFHHGAWLQTTITRPEMAQVGGRFIPIHFVGLLAEGRVPSGRLGLNYNVGIGNGRSSILSRAGDAGDVNNNRAWLVNIFARPARFYGLQVGGSIYGDELSPTSGPIVRELITSAHIVWTKETPEFLSEFANIRHRNTQTGQIINSQAFYVQVGYRLPWFEKRWKPYYRFEHIHLPLSEPVLNVPNLVESTVGLRYDISQFAAFKAEYRNFRRLITQPRVEGVFFQTAFTF